MKVQVVTAAVEEHVHRKCDLVLQYTDSDAQVGIVSSCISHTVLRCNEQQRIIGIL
jgi:hypothetical protein